MVAPPLQSLLSPAAKLEQAATKQGVRVRQRIYDYFTTDPTVDWVIRIVTIAFDALYFISIWSFALGVVHDLSIAKTDTSSQPHRACSIFKQTPNHPENAVIRFMSPERIVCSPRCSLFFMLHASHMPRWDNFERSEKRVGLWFFGVSYPSE